MAPTRLAHVRYLYNAALEQSHRPEPDASFSLLPFHDASEMFLQIIAEHYDISLNRNRFPFFLEYWELLKDKGVELPYRLPMQRLNDARNKLKHAGLLPHQNDVESFRATVTNFLQDASTVAMGMPFDQISLTSMIKSDEVRRSLEQAVPALAKGNLEGAMQGAAVAFKQSLREYETRLQRNYTVRGALTPSPLLAFSGLGLFGLNRTVSDIKEGLKNVIEVLGETVMVLGYNLDFDGYQLFKTHAPVVHEFGDGAFEVQWTHDCVASPEIAGRCLNFAIDTAIRLEKRRA
jgi:hypothetical protein